MFYSVCVYCTLYCLVPIVHWYNLQINWRHSTMVQGTRLRGTMYKIPGSVVQWYKIPGSVVQWYKVPDTVVQWYKVPSTVVQCKRYLYQDSWYNGTMYIVQGTRHHGTMVQGTRHHGTMVQGTRRRGTMVQGIRHRGTMVQGTRRRGTMVQGTRHRGIMYKVSGTVLQ